VEGLRVGDDLTQAAFARSLGVSRQYLCDVEEGRRLVSPDQAARFARAFGHPPNVLVELALQGRDSKTKARPCGIAAKMAGKTCRKSRPHPV
jgi:plasmid maintenance system antidote protein VapI